MIQQEDEKETKIKYSELIKEEKDNPQQVFNKTFKCPICGYCYYEKWYKVGVGEYEDDGRVLS